MKLKKKRKKDKQNKNNLQKSLLILTMIICITVAMITYWIYAYHHKYGTFYFDDIKLVSHKINDYLDIKGDMVYLKNTDSSIIEDFTKNQQNIINNNDVISVDISKDLKGNILSIMISYIINNGVSNYEEIITLNVNLKTDKVISNDELLEMANTNYKSVATNIFNENIKLPSDNRSSVVDAITDREMSSVEFNQNSEKYIIRIREKLPEILKLYIEDNTVYAVVKLSEIDKVCYYTNTNRLVNINREIGKI